MWLGVAGWDWIVADTSSDFLWEVDENRTWSAGGGNFKSLVDSTFEIMTFHFVQLLEISSTSSSWNASEPITRVAT